MEIIASAFGSVGQAVTQMLPQLFTLSVERPWTFSLGQP